MNGRSYIAALLLAIFAVTSNAAAPVSPAPVPAGFISFCIRNPDQCQRTAGAPDAVGLTPALWQEMRQVDTQVNNDIWPEDDEKHYGRAEYWTIPTDGYGDCDDYALTKRKALASAGIPEQALRIAVVRLPSGELHAVLTVVTDKGDFVLDNLTDQIVERASTPYTWIERQSPDDPRVWEMMQADTPDAIVTTAVK